MTAARLNKIAEVKTPGELQDIARKALATEPADRFASVKDFQAAIRVFREHQESDRLAVLARQRFEAALASKRYDDYAESVFGYRQALRLWPDNLAARQGLNQAALQYARTALDQGDLDLSLSLLKDEDETQRKLAQKVRQRIEERTRQTARIRALRRSLALAGVVVLALAAISAHWINQERIRATRGERTAQRALAESRGLLSESLEAAAGDRVSIGQDAEALALLAEALRQNPSNHVAASRTFDLLNRKDWALPVLDTSRLPSEGKIRFHPAPPAPFPKRKVAVKEISPRFVALQVETTNQPPIPLGDPIGPWEHPSTARATAAISPDGRFVALASGKRRLHVYDRFQGADAFPPFDLPASPWTLEFSPAGDLLAFGLRTGLIRFMDVFSGCSTRRNIFGPPGFAGVFVRNRSLFAMYSDAPPQVFFVDLRPGNARPVRMNLGGHIETAQFTPDGRGVVLSSGYGVAGVYSIETGEIQAGPVRLGNPCRISAISPDGLRCASATSKGQIILWSLGTGAELARVKAAHAGPIGALAFDPQGRFLASGGEDLQLRFWNAHSLAAITNLPVTGTVRSLAVSPDSKFLLAGVDHDAVLWNLESAGTPPENIGRGGWVRAVDMHPDGHLALWADYDRGHVFDLAARTNVAAGGNHDDAIWRAKFNPDGQSFATVSFDGYLRLWALSGEPITSPLQIHDGERGGSSTLAYSRDGRWIAAGGGKGLVRIWDTATGREILEPLRVASDRISAIDISADKKRIVIASWDGTATIQELVPCEAAPAWLPDLAEAVGGFRATGSGYDPLAWSNRMEILTALQVEAQNSTDHSVAIDWLRWFLAPRGKRTAGPWSSVTVSETVERLLKSPAPADIAEAVALAPNNPTCCLHMAEAMLPIDPVRAAFWAASARDLNPEIALPPRLAEILATAPFDETEPPGPEVFHLTAGEVKDFSPYAYREVVWHGTADFLLSNLGQSLLFFKESEAQLFGSIRKEYIPAIEQALGGEIQSKLRGRPIRLKGVLVPFKNQWEIQIVDPSQILLDAPSPPQD